MKDQYAGDVGDYVKLALLRALSIGHKLGVAWYLTSDEHEKNDGRHVGYLDHERERHWRLLDPKLYDQLRQIVHDGRRKVSALEQGLIEGDVRYYSRLLLSPSERFDWFEKLKTSFEDRDFVFVDPDNGIEPAGYKPGRKKSIKSVTLAEIETLVRPQRPLLVYHHQTRFPGGHEQEIEHIGEKLRKLRPGCICAIRARMSNSWPTFVAKPAGSCLLVSNTLQPGSRNA